MHHLIIVEHDTQNILPPTQPTVAAAETSGGKYDLLVLGENVSSVADQAKQFAGASKVFVADGAAQAHFLAENAAPVVAEIAKNYTHIWAPASMFGKNLMPRVSALLDVQQISDISDVLDADTFVRPIFAGNALAKVKSPDSIKLITVRETAFEPAPMSDGKAEVEQIDAGQDKGLTTFEGQKLSEATGPQLGTAKVVVSGGRGVASKENFALLQELADAFDNAAIGASRAAVDAGYVPNDMQVGQTGKVIAPNLYIALGISGAIQHLAGMMGSKHIVAINNDPDAPIFQVADYGLVGDLFEVLPALTKAVKEHKKEG